MGCQPIGSRCDSENSNISIPFFTPALSTQLAVEGESQDSRFDPATDFQIKEDSQKRSKRNTTALYLTISGTSALGGAALALKTPHGTWKNGTGLGVMTYGLSTLSFDLLDLWYGNNPMPLKWKIVSGLIGGVVVGFGSTYFGHFGPSGTNGNNNRLPIDEYGP